MRALPGIDQRVIRRIVAKLEDHEQRLNSSKVEQRLGRSSFENGGIAEYAGGQIVSFTGEQHDGTHGSQILDGPIPLPPTTPTVEGFAGGLSVTWDGRLVGDDGALAVVPLDFEQAEIFAAMGQAPIVDGPATDRLGSITATGGGTKTLAPLTAGEWWVSLRSRTVPGRTSALTPAVVVTVTDPVSPGDVALAAGRITVSSDEPTAVDAEGRPEGALWWQFDDTELVGAWRLESGTWVDLAIAPGTPFFPKVDIGQGTVGLLDVARLDADSIQAATAVVSQMRGLGIELENGHGEVTVKLDGEGDQQILLTSPSSTDTTSLSAASIATPALSVADSLLYRGKELGDSLADTAGQVIARGRTLATRNRARRGVGEFALGEIAWTRRAGRRYAIEIQPLGYFSSGVCWIWMYEKTAVPPASPASPNLTSGSVGGLFGGGGVSGGARLTVGGTYWIDATATENVRTIFSFWQSSGSGEARIENNDGGIFEVAITDLGPSVPNTMVDRTDVTGTPQPSPPPQKKTYTQTFQSVLSGSYYGTGAMVSGGSMWAGKALFGSYSGTQGNGRSLILFDKAAIQAALAGATVEDIELRLVLEHTPSYSAPVDFNVDVVTNASIPSTCGLGTALWTSSMRRGDDKWLTFGEPLKSDLMARAKAGSLGGIRIWGGGYGYLSTFAQLWIKYTK